MSAQGKDILFGKEAMVKMLKGLDTVANAVGGTIGPKGRNVYVDDPVQPKITNDGFTIAAKMQLPDKQEDAGAYVIRNVCGQTNDDAGDGTTTTAVLTQALIHECLARPENSMLISQSLKQAGNKALKLLAKQAVKLKKEDIEKVALISSEDKGIARLITEIIEKLGDKAVVNVEDSKTFGSDYEIVDGYEAHVGFMSPHFITDRKAAKAIYTDIPVLVSERKIANLQDIAPIFEMFKKEGISQCVIVCDDIEDSILGMLVQNKLMGTFNSLVIRATGPLLVDIEGATGAKAISATSGLSFKAFKRQDLGYAKKVVCNANTTLFATDGAAAKYYAAQLESQADNEPNQYAVKKLRERVAKLRGGVAVLRIGASTDFERDYLRLKAEDSVKAVQAALAEGVVEGGGMALWQIAEGLEPKTIGEEILKKALQAPLRKILDNAGLDYTEVVMDMPPGQGYNAKANKYANLREEGIIDPAKVERCALENAISASATFITTHAVVTEYQEPNDTQKA